MMPFIIIYAVSCAFIVMIIDMKNGIKYGPTDVFVVILSSWLLIPYALILSLFRE